jgi:hypothetical protein
MLQLVVFELAILIGMAGSLNKEEGISIFGWIATVVFIVWGIVQGMAGAAVM